VSTSTREPAGETVVDLTRSPTTPGHPSTAHPAHDRLGVTTDATPRSCSRQVSICGRSRIVSDMGTGRPPLWHYVVWVGSADEAAAKAIGATMPVLGNVARPRLPAP